MLLDHPTLVSLGSTLPPSLQVFSQLEQRMHDPLVDVSDLVALIRTDASLTFKLLRLANSVMFGRREPCDSLDEAVSRVGIREIQRLVGLASTFQAYQQDLTTYGFGAENVWDNALTTALMAEGLAWGAGRRTEGVYGAGLLRNLGRIVCDRVRANARYPGEERVPDLASWERGVFGTSGLDAAADLLAHWRLPAEIVCLVRHHTNPVSASDFSAETALLNVAGGLAAKYGAGLPGESACWREQGLMLERAGLDETLLEATEAEVSERLAQVRSALFALGAAA